MKVKGDMGDRGATAWDSPFTTLRDLRSRALAGPARRLRTRETSKIGGLKIPGVGVVTEGQHFLSRWKRDLQNRSLSVHPGGIPVRRPDRTETTDYKVPGGKRNHCCTGNSTRRALHRECYDKGLACNGVGFTIHYAWRPSVKGTRGFERCAVHAHFGFKKRGKRR